MARRGRGAAVSRPDMAPEGVDGATNGADQPGARTIGAIALQRWVARKTGEPAEGVEEGVTATTRGPYDEADLDPEQTEADKVDFGAVRIPVPHGGQVSVEPEEGRLQAVHVMLPTGRLSVSALAAPRTDRLWPDLAAEIDESLREGGATVRSFTGEWGRELHARTGEASSVFVGVDGPRLDALRRRDRPDQLGRGARRGPAPDAARHRRGPWTPALPRAHRAAADRARAPRRAGLHRVRAGSRGAGCRTAAPTGRGSSRGRAPGRLGRRGAGGATHRRGSRSVRVRRPDLRSAAPGARPERGRAPDGAVRPAPRGGRPGPQRPAAGERCPGRRAGPRRARARGTAGGCVRRPWIGCIRTRRAPARGRRHPCGGAQRRRGAWAGPRPVPAARRPVPGAARRPGHRRDGAAARRGHGRRRRAKPPGRAGGPPAGGRPGAR